ncbi:MAG: type II toxin-antitoxin system PemK/MazF family toxin [Xenococcaceae cyanobacterium]
MKISQRDIILVKFPFSDLSAAKVRPALVISSDRYHSKYQDAVVLAITSNLSALEYKVFIENQDLEVGSLPVKSAVRVDKPFSVLQSKVLKVQGKLKTQKFEEVKAKIANLID